MDSSDTPCNEADQSRPYQRKVQELSLLFEISQILDKSLDLKTTIHPVLEVLAERLGMHRGTISLLNRQTGQISIAAAYNLSSKQRNKGRYRLGEGITGRVISEGRAMVVPKISEEPTFLDRTGARQDLKKKDISFICVPIRLGNETAGALSVDRLFSDEYTLDEDERLLTIIASMIAQAVKLRQMVQEDKEALLEENSRLHQELKARFRPDNMIGSSRAMQEVYDLIAQVSRSEASVLILGESGTGKELVAQAVHYNSTRTDRPMVKVNCSALPENLIESELFGHEKGAFTGAVSARKGRFEQAQGGTIFLDEIGELSQAVQVKLLRVLQEGEIERVGSSRTVPVNVRVIAATNRNLESMIARGDFREDLYYRLNVFPIPIPPLRERRSDIVQLADHFCEKYSRKNRKAIHRITTSAIELLTRYHWPGNVRELENCIERGVILSTDQVIHGNHLPPSLQSAESTGTGFDAPLQESLDSLEREILLDTLKSTRGNMSKAARILEITERQMGLRVRKYSIDLSLLR